MGMIESEPDDATEAPAVTEESALDAVQSERDEFADRIEQAVWRETGGAVRNLRVEVTDKGVRLIGRCNTYYTKQKAQKAAWDSGADPNNFENMIEVT